MRKEPGFDSTSQNLQLGLFANIPYRFGELVAADVAAKLPPALLDFPINVLYRSVEKATPDMAIIPSLTAVALPETTIVLRACYTADVSTLKVDSRMASMFYRPEFGGDFSVQVEIDRTTKQMWVRKFRGGELRVTAQGTDFRRTLIQATCVGVAPDEPSTVEGRQDP